MRRVVEPTAPATTVPTISTDMRRPSPPNASRNGTNSDGLLVGLLLHHQPRPRAGHRAVRERRRDGVPRVADAGRGAGVVEPVEHLVAAGRRGQGRETARGHPGVRGLAHRTGQADDRDVPGVRAVPHGQGLAHQHPEVAAGGQHRLTGLLRPPPLGQAHPVDARPRTRPGGDGQDRATCARGRLRLPRWRTREHHDLSHGERAGGRGDARGVGGGGQLRRSWPCAASVNTVRCAPCCAAKAWSNGAFDATSSPTAQDARGDGGGGGQRDHDGLHPAAAHPGADDPAQRAHRSGASSGPRRCRRRSGRRRARSCGSRTRPRGPGRA